MPIYLMLSTNFVFRSTREPNCMWMNSEVAVMGSNLLHGLVSEVWASLFRGPYQIHPWAVFLVLMRAVSDLSMMFFSLALACYLSIRCASVARSVVLSCLIAVCAAATVLDLHNWVLFACIRHIVSMEVNVCNLAYLLFGMGTFAGRIWLALWLVKRAARNFDWYALGEKPPVGRS